MKKLNRLFMIYVLGLLTLLIGCSQDGLDNRRPATGDDLMTFTFRIDGMTTNSATRSAISPAEGETTVESLHLLFFNASGTQSGTLAGTVELPGSVGTSGRLAMETSYLLPDDGADISATGAYNIIGIGNLDKYVDDTAAWLEQWEGQTEAFFRDNAVVDIEGTNNEGDYTSYRPIKADALLMNGYTDKPAGANNIQMVLTRNVARFDVQNNAASHTLQTVSVWNAFKEASITGDALLNYTKEAAHTKRFYGIECENTVLGGLYAFANYSESPTVNDKTSTCLIVGLESNGSKRYYRVNINSMGASQRLKNDHAYNITILSVTGEGYASENEAWEGTTNQLIYAVNNWNLDDNGLIVSDEYSILAVPIKTVKIGSAGGDFSYSVTTFSTLDNPEPLQIKSQLYEPADGNITARISNGNLVIEALPMNTGEEKRSGIITVSFAGLETMVNVLQTAAGDVYLELTLDDGWKEFLPPTANAMSDYVYVNASGPWTAQLHGSANFAFQNSLGDYVTKISSADFTNNKFHVYTSASNESKTDTEKGFVLVSLDSDPTNYIAVVTVNQASRGGIDTNPANLETIRFFGSGRLQNMTDNLETNSNTHFKFQVSSSGSITANNVRLTGTDYEKFGFTFDPDTKHIIVWAKDVNATSEPYTAVITIADNRNGNLMINLVQGTLDLTLDAPERRVPVIGGTSDEIVVSIEDPNAEWTATVTATTSGARPVIGHDVKLVKADGADLEDGEFTNQNLKVKFDKVYYPNRETEIKAIVTVTTRSGLTKTCEVYQNKLTTPGIHIWSVYVTRWGALTESGTLGFYIGHFNQYLRDNGSALAAPGGISWSAGTSLSDYGNSVPSSTNWYQFSNNDASSAASYAGVNKYFNTYSPERLTMLQAGHGAMANNTNEHSFAGPSKLGFNFVNSSVSIGGNVSINTAVRDTRVYQFIMVKGRKYVGTEDLFGLYNDAINCGVTAYPEGAVPLLKYNNGQFNLVIDPVNNVVFHGDETAFYGTYFTNNTPVNTVYKSAFMANYIDYLANAAKYGSHFTEMFIDNSSVPAPWDDHWGANAWPN